MGMKRNIFLLLIGIIASGCSYKPSSPQRAQPVNLAEKNQVTVKVGDTLYADMPVHGSVGIAATYQISDPKILEMYDSKLTYARKGPIPPGGDAAIRRFNFRALAPGTATLKLMKEFRGRIDETQIVQVIVTPQ